MKLLQQVKAKRMRARGYSVKEIAAKLNVAQSSVSYWVCDIPLSSKAKQRLLERIKIGQYIAAENKKRVVKLKEAQYLKEAQMLLATQRLTSNQEKLMCAIMYWCEGTKNVKDGINFINSDPYLVKKFLTLLRKHYLLNEKRLKIKLHLHSYHNEKMQKKFWGRILNISKDSFAKSYQKPNMGKRYRENYPGCAVVRYHSVVIARQLKALAKSYLEYKM